MNYPVPNPRVIAKSEDRPFEFYLDQTGEYSAALFEAFALFLQKTTYAWVVDYTRFHDNYLPPRETTIFSTTEELLACLKFSDSFSQVSPEAFQALTKVLPDTGWYIHPTYPLSLAQIP